jgi:prepilin-type N-terminal cleavage/methylation domain-containing protein
MNRTNRRCRRAGFTLIELLVVISIIVVLVGLSMAAYQRVRITQFRRTSEDIVSKIQTGIDNQVKIIADNVRREQMDKSTDYSTLLTWCDNDPDRAAAVLMYCRLRQNLPATSAELNAASFALGGVTFPRPPAFASLAGVSDPSPEKVSAAALYIALSQRTIGGNTFAVDDATAGAQLDISLIGVGNVRVFKDGWGNPIPFQRFYQSAELDAAPYVDAKLGAGAQVGKDTFDIRGKISTWSDATKRGQVQSTLGIPAWNRNTTVLVYSWGQNQVADAPLGVTDDIMGYRLRSIGAKGAKQ